MNNSEIIQLYFDRNEDAITQTKLKYDKYCYSISYRILCDHGDSEECVNDTYISAWNTIPPKKPLKLSLYLAAITRNLSIKRLRYNKAQKRDSSKDRFLSELEECIPDAETPDTRIEEKMLSSLLDGFIRSLEHEEKCFFIKRYWYMYSISDIANEYKCSESKVKMKLKRTRDKLQKLLEKEEIYL